MCVIDSCGRRNYFLVSPFTATRYVSANCCEGTMRRGEGRGQPARSAPLCGISVLRHFGATPGQADPYPYGGACSFTAKCRMTVSYGER